MTEMFGIVELTHPDYAEALLDWEMMRDCLEGDRKIKERAELYLPMPGGFKLMADGGKAAYLAYKTRAKFPPLVAPILRGMAGILNRVEPKIEAPSALDDMMERTTRSGDPIEVVYRRIVRDLLTTGRVAVLTDMPVAAEAKSDSIPYLAFYEAERLVNWSREHDFYVLDETRLVRNGFAWWPVRRYRVLELVDGKYQVTLYDMVAGGDTENIPEPSIPLKRGSQLFTEIPLVVAGALDLRVDISEVPLIGVAQAALAGYRLDADYRHQLYNSGQETFVVEGVTKEQAPPVIGAGVIYTVPVGGKAYYVSPACKGIDAHRAAMQDEVEAAAVAGARMFTNAQRGRSAESGDALKLRFSGETATLTSIAQSAAQCLERALKYAAQFMDVDPDEVNVTPNLSLVDASLSATDAVALTSVWTSGAISKQTLYENLQRGEIASQERTLEEEQALIDDEPPPPAPPNMQQSKLGSADRNSLIKPPSNSDIAKMQNGGFAPPDSSKSADAGAPGR
jgi:hypothetical protein